MVNIIGMDLLSENYSYKEEILPDGTILIYIKEVKDELSVKVIHI